MTSPQSIILDANTPPFPHPAAQEITTNQPEPSGRRRSRKKKRKKSLVDGDGGSSAIQTRQPSIEEGEVEGSTHQTGSLTGSTEAKPNITEILRGDLEHRYHPPSQITPPPSRSTLDETNIFFVDLKPALIPSEVLPKPALIVEEPPASRLLLPAHVSVFGGTPVEILPSLNSGEEDYIEYLDYDDRQDLVRYFEKPADDASKIPSRVVCKNCGGDHKTSECQVLICLTCGARNEHPTRSCPISKTCYTCGMKGHINATCPNRMTAYNTLLNRHDDCTRCGSELHKTNECPTLWRLYEYFSSQDKDRTVRIREERKGLSLGEGGEGYIASDQWCYNCGTSGHWGDDCQDIPHNKDLPLEPSAFGIYNTSSGPFYDPLAAPSTLNRREPRDWEDSKWGSNAPDDVGRQARRKNIVRMERRALEQEGNDDPDDWFGKIGKARKVVGPSSTSNGSSGSKKLNFGKSLRDAAQQFQTPSPSPPSLLERLSDKAPRGRQSRPSFKKHEHDSHHYPNYNRHWQDLERDRHRRRDEGPRYKGGYRI